ncbi:MAG TPA: sigma-70 family RNA polymerase sigma factor [Terriglobia bacterium]|nr:sigma-70 family RNA polymerase sigma factor [Terriglobia bacterium]
MDEHEWLAERFEENRSHLRAVAYRMLGSPTDADDAVQESWLRLSRSDASSIENIGGWLTTVVSRVCLDMLRSRTARREEPLDAHVPEPAVSPISSAKHIDPEREALLADSVGLAMLVVLDRLTPAERLAFVLHDTFAVSFEEIASILGRSPTAVRQLASRARRRVRGAATASANVAQQREVVDAFLAAMRSGDFKALVAVLDPDVVVRIDETAARAGGPMEIRGAENWAKGAIAFARHIQFVGPALVNGNAGLIWAPHGQLLRALTFRIVEGKIVQAEVIADPARLRQLDLAVLNG